MKTPHEIRMIHKGYITKIFSDSICTYDAFDATYTTISSKTHRGTQHRRKVKEKEDASQMYLQSQLNSGFLHCTALASEKVRSMGHTPLTTYFCAAEPFSENRTIQFDFNSDIK